MITFETEKYNYKSSKKELFVFDKSEILIKRIQLPNKEHVKGFYSMYYEEKKLKVFFDTNDTYDYKATLDEETFEFTDWGFTK